MLIGYFTERPYQDPKSGYFGATGRSIQDLSISNDEYDPLLGADLYNRYLDEKLYVEEVGFDAIMLNEHHSTPFCMGGVMNLEAAILAKTTDHLKIVLNGNILPIWDDPLWLAESLATIDMISRGRLVSGWVRGTGRESVSHNAQPPFNWERFQEAHDFVIKAWTTPGPFRWEGEHYDYRYVNPWMRPFQQPHPLIMIPGVLSRNTVAWSAKHRYPYVMLATRLEPTKQSFDYYREVAREEGYEAGSEHIGYLFKVHVDETEELAYEVGRKFLEGPGNIFLEGSRGTASPVLQNLPGLTDRNNLLPTGQVGIAAASRGHTDLAQQAAERLAEERERRTADGHGNGAAAPARAAAPQAPAAAMAASYDEQLENYTIITGTPKTVIPKIRRVLETLRPGSIFFWDGDGAMTHDDAMRSLRLFGSDVLPAVREMAEDLELVGPFERSPLDGQWLADGQGANAASVAAGAPAPAPSRRAAKPARSAAARATTAAKSTRAKAGAAKMAAPAKTAPAGKATPARSTRSGAGAAKKAAPAKRTAPAKQAAPARSTRAKAGTAKLAAPAKGARTKTTRPTRATTATAARGSRASASRSARTTRATAGATRASRATRSPASRAKGGATARRR